MRRECHQALARIIVFLLLSIEPAASVSSCYSCKEPAAQDPSIPSYSFDALDNTTKAKLCLIPSTTFIPPTWTPRHCAVLLRKDPNNSPFAVDGFLMQTGPFGLKNNDSFLSALPATPKAQACVFEIVNAIATAVTCYCKYGENCNEVTFPDLRSLFSSVPRVLHSNLIDLNATGVTAFLDLAVIKPNAPFGYAIVAPTVITSGDVTTVLPMDRSGTGAADGSATDQPPAASSNVGLIVGVVVGVLAAIALAAAIAVCWVRRRNARRRERRATKTKRVSTTIRM